MAPARGHDPLECVPIDGLRAVIEAKLVLRVVSRKLSDLAAS